jgi:hypothetical protein
MILYNVTTKLHYTICGDWLQWLQEEHIPDIINTGCFTHAKVLQLLEPVDDDSAATYTVQFFAESKSLYNNYVENFAPVMRQKAFDKWSDKFISFRSVMQVVN